jgi:hypothetical protein
MKRKNKKTYSLEFLIGQHSLCNVVERQTFDQKYRPVTEEHGSYIVREDNRRNAKRLDMIEQKIQN